MDWKPWIISLTELPAAREAKIDASFFPPVSEASLAAWESEHGSCIPRELRSFQFESDGLEAQRGEIWPVLPMSKWEFLDCGCVSPDPWIRFAETLKFRYLISLDDRGLIYRHETFGSKEEFFAASFSKYLEKVFANEA